jgi:hypothetical protein
MGNLPITQRVNMDKWVSGEVETFFTPQQAPPAPVVADGNHNEEMLLPAKVREQRWVESR